jgi:O-antigen ligase
MVVMAGALFLTASRGGFIEFVVAGSVCLWHFGVRGKRPQLIAACFLIGMVFLVGAGGKLKERFAAISGDINTSLDQSAYGSYEERQALIMTSLKGMLHYPILGIGVHNFTTYSGRWKEVHNSYLQIGVEGGIPALVLYLLFFWSGFSNLRRLRKKRDLDPQIMLFVGALHSSLVGFTVGALFSPEAYQFFPYFAVAHTSVILAIVVEREGGAVPEAQLSKPSRIQRYKFAGSGDSSTVPSIR